MKDIEELARIAVDCGFQLHKRLGPGLLESAYLLVMEERLRRCGLNVRREVPISIRVDDIFIEAAFRADLIVEDRLVIELKSQEALAKVHQKQLLTYLRLMDLPLGLLMNFGAATFAEGCRRVVNNHTEFASSRLRVSQIDAATGRNERTPQ